MAKKDSVVPSWFPKIGAKKGRVYLYKATMVAFAGARRCFGKNGELLKFEEFPMIFRENITACALFFIKNPSGSIIDFHNEWCDHLRQEGWVMGVKTIPESRQTAFLVPFEDLSPHNQAFLVAFSDTIKAIIELDVFELTKNKPE